jgi:dTDP-4-dehydrorhamnose 3,5-epimerase
VTVLETPLPDVKLLEARRLGDERGWFAEMYNERVFAAAGLPTHFAQDNQSFSRRGVLRGIHYQLGRPQGKLVRVLRGHIWDVAVDLRPDSPYFGRYAGFDLMGPESSETLRMVWIPEGFGHGFVVLTETAEVLYKTTDLYYPQGERCILWNDETLGIEWPLEGMTPSISAKDARGCSFRLAEIPQVVG